MGFLRENLTEYGVPATEGARLRVLEEFGEREAKKSRFAGSD